MGIVKYDSARMLGSLEAIRVISKEDANMSTEQIKVLGLINDAMSRSQAGVLPLVSVGDDSFITSSDLIELAQRCSLNAKVILAECQALMATSQVVNTIISGMESESQSACFKASEAVRTLLAYHEALASSGRSVVVIPDHMTGSFSLVGSVLTSAIVGGNDARTKVSSVSSNGRLGNMLELTNNTQTGKPLLADEITFVDEKHSRQRTQSLTDNDETTSLEIEAYKVDLGVSAAVVDENIMPNSLTKVQQMVSGTTTMVPVAWADGPAGGTLYADLTLENESGSISVLSIKIAERTDSRGAAIPIPAIERIDVSDDGDSWSEVSCPYDAIMSAAGGEIRVHVNSPTARFIKVRFRQSVPYTTIVANAAHWMVPADGSAGRWMTGSDEPVYKFGINNKSSWFMPIAIEDASGNIIKRKAFGLPAQRYCIAIREAKGEANQYSTISVSESKTYHFNEEIDRVMIRANEFIPEGCNIEYEISHDEGATWTRIIPMERSGQGAEVIVFSAGSSSNPSVQSAAYVQVKERPKNLRIRVRLRALDRVAPSIQKLSIEPIFIKE